MSTKINTQNLTLVRDRGIDTLHRRSIIKAEAGKFMASEALRQLPAAQIPSVRDLLLTAQKHAVDFDQKVSREMPVIGNLNKWTGAKLVKPTTKHTKFLAKSAGEIGKSIAFSALERALIPVYNVAGLSEETVVLYRIMEERSHSMQPNVEETIK